MNHCRIATITMSILLAVSVSAANPFLDAPDDKPVSAKFRGTEWGEEIQQEEIPLTALVVTTRVAKMPWGAIFKIELTDVKWREPHNSKIGPDYFIVTGDRIVLLPVGRISGRSGIITEEESEEDNDAAVKKISALDKPPQFEPDDIYGITSGSFDHEEGPWKTTIRLKGDLCTYHASHPSGHFKKIVWKKGVGVVEYASGYGAVAYGYRLKRVATRQKR